MFKSTPRLVLFVSIFVLVLGLGLVVFLPLSVVAQKIQNTLPELNIQSAEGTWWQGSFNQISWQKSQPTDLHWQLSWGALLSGQIAAQVDIAQPGLQAKARIHWPSYNTQHEAMQTLGVTSGQINLDITQITPYASYPLSNISGQLTALVEQLELDLQGLQASHDAKLLPTILKFVKLKAPVHFFTSDIVLLNSVNLGKLSGQITRSSTPPSYQIELQNSDGPLAISGNSIVTDRQIKSDYQVLTDSKTDRHLVKLLELIGKPTATGHYRFNTVYNL